MAAIGNRVRVRIYDQQIDAMFGIGGDVYGEAMDTAREVKAQAVIRAPKRSTLLSRKHQITSRGRRPFGMLVGVFNDTSYSEIVHDGYPLRIMRKGANRYNGKKLRLPPWGAYGFTYKQSVAGQSAQPWLTEAADAVMLRKYRVRVRRY